MFQNGESDAHLLCLNQNPAISQDIPRLENYQYARLETPSRDIRLVELLPGEFDDEIHIRLQAVSLNGELVPKKRLIPSHLTSELARLGWEVHETLDGRLVFVKLVGGRVYSQWECPIDSPADSIVSDEEVDKANCEYEALSYTWGLPGNEDTVVVEGSPATQLSIRKNLGTALRHLRDGTSSRSLWIDAISINQEDNMEKLHQVQKMSEIFQSASRVVIWLGEETESSCRALGALQYVGQQVESLSNRRRIPSPDAVESDWHDVDIRLPIYGDTCQAIHELLSRAWFFRVWVIQEAELGSNQTIVQCGYHSVPYASIRKAIDCIKNNHTLPAWLRNYLPQITRMTDTATGLSLHNMLGRAYGKLATDGRDLVYGVLGLLPPEMRIQPDYFKPVNEVYRDITVKNILQVHRLEMATRTFQYGRLIRGMP